MLLVKNHNDAFGFVKVVNKIPLVSLGVGHVVVSLWKTKLSYNAVCCKVHTSCSSVVKCTKIVSHKFTSFD